MTPAELAADIAARIAAADKEASDAAAAFAAGKGLEYWEHQASLVRQRIEEAASEFAKTVGGSGGASG